MPAQISHILASEEALALALPGLAEAWGMGRGGAGGEAAAWFRLGAQGPDIFYHNQRTKPSGLHYGVLAHRRGYGSLVEGALGALRASGGSLGDPEAAWLLGFATHAALDRAAHPFIVCFSGWQTPLRPETARYRSCHPFLERILDLRILAARRGLAPGDFDLEALLPLPGEALGERAGPIGERVAGLLAAGLRSAFPKASSADFLLEARVGNALLDALYFFRITNPARRAGKDLFSHFDDRQGWRAMSLLYPEALPADFDAANDRRAPWPHPAGDGRSSDASYSLLFEEGVAEAVRALKATAEAFAADGAAPPPPAGRAQAKEEGPGGDSGEGRGALAALLGDGGLSVADPEGNAVPPRVSTPLPLMELMEIELAARLEAAKRLAAPAERR